MRNFLELVQNHKIAPTCLSCGSYFRREAFFCSRCFSEITEKYQKFENSKDPIDSLDVFTLYRWVANASDSLSKAIHLLKLAESKPAWQFLGKLFSEEILKAHSTTMDLKRTVLIPVPGRQSASKHTDFFSEIMSNNLGVKRVQLLRNIQSPSQNEEPRLQQKELTRQQRLSRQFNFCVDFTHAGELQKMQNIVLIDDVVTTGATLQACKREIRALKHNAKVSAWVMFRRL